MALTKGAKVGLGLVTALAAVFGVKVATTPSAPSVPEPSSITGTPPPADICTGPYVYVDACGDWRINWPGQGPNTDQGACAHARTAQDPSNGVRYYIVGQGAGGTRYPKPPASAAFALSEWNKCFVDHDTSGNFSSCSLPPVAGTQSPIMRTLAWPGIPPAKRDSWNEQFHCNVPTIVPTPLPSLTPTAASGACTPREVTRIVTQTPTRTATPRPPKPTQVITAGPSPTPGGPKPPTPGPKPTSQPTKVGL